MQRHFQLSKFQGPNETENGGGKGGGGADAGEGGLL